MPPSLQSAAGFCCFHPSQQCFLLRTIFVCFLLRFVLKFISLVRATSRLPNRFLPFPHGSHVLLGVRAPRALSHSPGRARADPLPGSPSACRTGVALCPPANRGGRAQEPETGGARPTPTAPGGSARRAPRGRERAERLAASSGVRLRTGVVFHKAALKVSWQPPAARLCKETTERSRSVE